MHDRLDATRIVGSFNYSQVSRGAFQACYLGYKIATIAEKIPRIAAAAMKLLGAPTNPGDAI